MRMDTGYEVTLYVVYGAAAILVAWSRNRLKIGQRVFEFGDFNRPHLVVASITHPPMGEDNGPS